MKNNFLSPESDTLKVDRADAWSRFIHQKSIKSRQNSNFLENKFTIETKARIGGGGLGGSGEVEEGGEG